MQSQKIAKSVFMVVNTYAPDDPRVFFSASSLQKLGYDVTLLGAARQKGNALVRTQQSRNNVSILIVPQVDSLWSIPQALFRLISGNLPPQISTSLRMTSILSLLFFNLWVLRIGLFRSIDVIHCHDLSPLFACWLLSMVKRAPLIYDIHEDVPTFYAGTKGRIMTKLERFLVPKLDYVIAAGHRLAEAMPQRGAKQAIHIGNWKPLPDYDIPHEEVQNLREKWHIPQDALLISFLGTLDEDRDVPTLLDVVANSDKFYLMIAGRGDYRDLVVEYAEKYENIIWLNWVDLAELPLYTLAADALYYCRSDKMRGGSYDLAPAPNKLYEAFAAARPIIAKRGVGEIGEILEDNAAGILVDEISPESVKSAMEQLRNPDLYAEKQAAARAAGEKYNWAVAEQRLSEVYQTLLS